MNAIHVIDTHLPRTFLESTKLLRGILLIILAALGAGCQSDQTRQADRALDYQLSKSTTLTFPLDNDTSPTVYIAQYYSDKSKEWVFLLNKYINGCVVFDVKTGKQIRSIQIPREGPGAIA